MQQRPQTSLVWRGICASLKRCQNHICIFLLALGAVEVVLLYVMNHTVWQQVPDALSSTQRTTHMRGWDVIGHPFLDNLNVFAIIPKQVRSVYKLVGVVAVAGDADQTVAQDLSNIFLLPQIGNPKGLQDVSPTQQH